MVFNFRGHVQYMSKTYVLPLIATGAVILETDFSTIEFLSTDHQYIWVRRNKRLLIIHHVNLSMYFFFISICERRFLDEDGVCRDASQAAMWNKISLQSTIVKVDSSTAISIAYKEQASTKTKRIDLKVQHVRKLRRRNVIEQQKILNKQEPADLLTKSQTRAQLNHCVTLLSFKCFNTAQIRAP